MLDKELQKLQETWSFTTEEINDIKYRMASYALAAYMDGDILKEAIIAIKENVE